VQKLISIAFIAILLLNVMGYYGVFIGLQYRNDIAMMKVLDSNVYEKAHMLTIRIPVSIPYMNDDADFERVDGKFEHEGEVYRLLKQKYAQDTLTVVCIKDSEDKRINQALSNYVKSFTDKATDQHSNLKVTINFIKDYIPQTFSLRSVAAGWTTSFTYNSIHNVLISTFTASVIHPPERA
jgi:hypothetical protein